MLAFLPRFCPCQPCAPTALFVGIVWEFLEKTKAIVLALEAHFVTLPSLSDFSFLPAWFGSLLQELSTISSFPTRSPPFIFLWLRMIIL